MSYTCSASGDASGFRGCGRQFGSLTGFDHHWKQVTREDDPGRDRRVVDIGGRRCMTDDELATAGFEFVGSNWRDAAKAAATRAAFGRTP